MKAKKLKSAQLKDKNNKNEKINPFEVHINRSKHKVLGQKSKDDRGLPGVSRGKAYNKRKETLLPEYRDRFKNSTFIDKRIGEKNKFLDPEKKIMMRMVAEKMRQYSKKSIYNLNDEEQLFHGGRQLDVDTMKDKSGFSDDDDDEDLLDADYVKDKHFGGEIFTKPKENGEKFGHKSKQEWIDEIIAESKKKKAEAKVEKEFHNETVNQLDEKYQEFMSSLREFIMTDDDKEKSKKTCTYQDYDKMVRELMFDRTKRAAPANPLKTEEELAKEEEQRLKGLEEDRQRRMNGETESYANYQKSADALNGSWSLTAKEIHSKDKFKKMKKLKKGRSRLPNGKDDRDEDESEDDKESKHVDDIEDDNENIEDDIEDDNENSEDDNGSADAEEEEEVDGVVSEDEDDDIEGEEDDDDVGEEDGVEEEKDEGVIGGEEEEGAVEVSSEEEEEDDENCVAEIESGDENSTSELEEESIKWDLKELEGEEEEEEDEEDWEEENYQRHSESSEGKTSKHGKVEECDKGLQTPKEDEDELPYTYEVPIEYDNFWNLLQEKTPSEVSTIIDRMIVCHHPSLKPENKNKCNTIFAYILQTLHGICSPDPEIIKENIHPFSYIDSFIPHLYTLNQQNPPDSASALTQVIDEKYQDYSSKRLKTFPHVDTFVFLKIAGLLFPASDYNHDVMTRVLTFITQLLGEAKVTSGRHLICLLFCASLLFEYLKRSRRFVGELVNALNGILYISIPASPSKESLPICHPFRHRSSASELLVLKEPIKRYELPKLKLTHVNEEIELNNNYKVKIVDEALILLDKLCLLWTNLISAKAIFIPTTKILTKLPLENYPGNTAVLLNNLRNTINALPAQGPHLKKPEEAMKTLRMIDPVIEEVFEGVKSRTGSKDMQEQRKLIHKLKRERKGAKRELKRDAQFIARQQLQEVLQSDAERKRKVNLIMQDLGLQENEFKKMKKK